MRIKGSLGHREGDAFAPLDGRGTSPSCTNFASPDFAVRILSEIKNDRPFGEAKFAQPNGLLLYNLSKSLTIKESYK